MGPYSHARYVRQHSILDQPVPENPKVSWRPPTDLRGANENRHLKPGTGYMEQVEIDWTPRCEGGPLPPDFRIPFLLEELLSAMDEAGLPMRVDSAATRNKLRVSGFVDINEQTIQCPWNGWSSNSKDKETGRWFNLCLTQGLQALTMAPLTRVKRWTYQQVNELVDQVKVELGRRQVHGYFVL